MLRLFAEVLPAIPSFAVRGTLRYGPKEPPTMTIRHRTQLTHNGNTFRVYVYVKDGRITNVCLAGDLLDITDKVPTPHRRRLEKKYRASFVCQV